MQRRGFGIWGKDGCRFQKGDQVGRSKAAFLGAERRVLHGKWIIAEGYRVC